MWTQQILNMSTELKSHLFVNLLSCRSLWPHRFFHHLTSSWDLFSFGLNLIMTILNSNNIFCLSSHLEYGAVWAEGADVEQLYPGTPRVVSLPLESTVGNRWWSSCQVQTVCTVWRTRRNTWSPYYVCKLSDTLNGIFSNFENFFLWESLQPE